MSQYLVFLSPFRLAGFPVSGGDEEIRTLDPLLAGQVLSQLSYTPRGFILFPLRTLKIEQRTTTYLHNSTFFASRCEKRVLCFLYRFSKLNVCPVISGSDTLLRSRTVSIERR